MNDLPVSGKVYQHAGNQPVLALIPPTARTVLDLGCGAGDNARLLRERGIVVDGVTLSPDEATLAAQQCRKVWLHDLEKGLPPDLVGPYDAVLCSHVLEHVCFPEKLLGDVRRVFPDAPLVVALPNMLFYRNRLRLLFGRLEYESGGLMDNTHFRWYSFASARQLMKQHGYTDVMSLADGSLPLPGLRQIFPAALLARVDRLAVRLFPGLFGYQLLYRCSTARGKD